MEVKYNVCGPRRKEMVQAVSEALGGWSKQYLGVPSCSYQVGDFEITRNGTLVFADRTDAGMVEQVLEALAKAGFACEEAGKPAEPEAPGEAEQPDETAAAGSGTEAEDRSDAATLDGLTVSLPKESFTEAALDNLDRLLESKGSLIRKAFGIEEAVYTLTDDRLTFAWLTGDITPEKA